jgi:hypothetical protein
MDVRQGWVVLSFPKTSRPALILLFSGYRELFFRE